MASLTQDRICAVAGPPRWTGSRLVLAVLALGAIARPRRTRPELAA